MKIKAFLFDLDGVLTDTAEYHYQAWKKMADRRGMRFDRGLNERLKGVSRLRSLEIILEANGMKNRYTEEEKRKIAEEKNKIYVELIQKITPRDILPGVIPFLDEAKKGEIKLAVASASKNADTVLRRLQIADRFHYIADASKIVHAKPDPEVFLNCAENLGIKPGLCVGFEDAQAGIEAIHAAGMYAVGIGVNVVSEHPEIELKDTGELDYQSLTERMEMV